ncbi:hypothetical protein AB3S75_047052 [Citrus x aurantiifolia]
MYQTYCSDEDLGSHIIQHGGDFNWEFRIDIGSSLIYDCDLSFANVRGHYKMFDERRAAVRCGNQKCPWKVHKDGIYLYIKELDADRKQFSWLQL